MPNPVVHFEIMAKDGARAETFYSELFGWKIDSNNPMNYGIVDNAGEGINGGVGSTPDGQAFVTFYVQVDDLQAYLDKAVKLDGKVLVPVTEIPNMVTLAQFEDPDGNRIGLVKEM